MVEDKSKLKNRLPYLRDIDPNFKQTLGNENEGFYIYNMQAEMPKHWNEFDEEKKHDLRWYYSICSIDETERIMEPKNISDYLLRMRADSILSNIRISRSVAKRAESITVDNWSLESQFNDDIFNLFKKEVNEKYNNKLDDITFGTLYSDKARGSCIKTKYGIIILFSEALKQFLYFMNLFYFDFNDVLIDISSDTKSQSLFIALRTMMLRESFDFEIDPRGDIPSILDKKLNEIVNYELFFIIAHEYAHILLKHFNEKRLNIYKFYPKHNETNITDRYYEYASSKRKEYEADNLAIDILCGDDKDQQKDVILYAITVMAFIDLFYYVKNMVNKKTYTNRTHPSINKRFKKLVKRGNKIWDKDQFDIVKEIILYMDFIKEKISESFNEDPYMLTFYGSIYLTQWKKDFKRDRIDY